MVLQPFVFNSFGVNGFVLNNDAGDAILIDPSVSNKQEEEALARYIEKKKFDDTPPPEHAFAPGPCARQCVCGKQIRRAARGS